MAETRANSFSLTHTLVATWRTLSRELFESYHPEQHYMRGPGPKWHAKHAPTAVSRAEPAMAATLSPVRG